MGLGVLLFLASCLFIPKNNMEEFGMDDVKANGILGEKEDIIDVLVLGDSESFTTISPMQIWGQQGFTSYVCGTSGQPLYQSETLLAQALEKQKPKVVILETNAIYRDISLQSVLLNRLENLFPVLRYHDRWKQFRANEVLAPVEYTWTDDYKGFEYNATVVPSTVTDHMTPTDQAAPIKWLNRLFVKRMAELCRKNGAEFVLVSTPSTVNWNYARHNGIQKLADAWGITYVDMNLMKEEVPIDWARDTRDAGDHLNYYGAVKVTAWLGNYLKQNYDLPDHRQDSAYMRWGEAYVRYQSAVGD